MQIRLILAFILQTFICQFAWSSESEIGLVILSAPGEPISSADGKALTRKAAKKQAWHSILLDGSDLIVDRAMETRASDWLIATRKSFEDVTRFKSVSFKSDGHTLALPKNALFAVRVTNDNDVPLHFKPGRYPSLVTTGQLLLDGWETAVSISGATWTVSAKYEKRPDGVLLAGSMSLLAVDSSGQGTLLVPPASGMAFIRHEMVWLGDLNGDLKPDLILRRIWVTGEIEYVLVVGPTLGSVYVDTDNPYRAFSSGVDESFSISRHINQQVPLPTGRFGKSAFAFSEEVWNRTLGSANQKLPRLIADRQLKIGDENIRFTFEYLPRSESQEITSLSDAFVWGGPVLVKVHFRNKTQVLMQAPSLDGGPLRVQVDKINGQPAIEIFFSPHYNNSFTNYWIWNPSHEGRFFRLFIAHSQGC